MTTAYDDYINQYDDYITGRKWWSRLYMKMIWKVDDNILTKRTLDMIPENFDGKLLDIPVGTMIFTKDFYKNFKGQVIGVDYAEEMVRIAQTRSETMPHVSIEQGDVGSLRFEDESFDIVMCMNSFHAFPDKDKAFAETFRVLKRGGLLIGSMCIRGQLKAADFVAHHFLRRKGFFLPPHLDKEELETKLRSLYSQVEVNNVHAVALFKCLKS